MDFINSYKLNILYRKINIKNIMPNNVGNALLA